MQILDCEQNSIEWMEARLGTPTASSMAKLMAKGQGTMRSRLMHDLIAERITGEPACGYSNAHMQRGHQLEADAVSVYSEQSGDEVQRVGFVRNFDDIGGVGCSPDALVGDRGGLEIKTRLPGLQVELLLADRVPPEHKAQIQCCLWVTERDWWDFVSYCPGMPLFLKRVERDEDYIKEMRDEVTRFHTEMQDKIARIKGAA